MALFFKPTDNAEDEKRMYETQLVFMYVNALTTITTMSCLALGSTPLLSFILTTATIAVVTNFILRDQLSTMGCKERFSAYLKKSNTTPQAIVEAQKNYDLKQENLGYFPHLGGGVPVGTSLAYMECAWANEALRTLQQQFDKELSDEIRPINDDISVNISYGATLAFQKLHFQIITNALESLGKLIGIDHTSIESCMANCNYPFG